MMLFPSLISLIVSKVLNTTLKVIAMMITSARRIRKIDCLPVLCTILFAIVTPKNTPITVHKPYHNPLYTFISPFIVYVIELAKAEFITKNMEVEEATNGGYPRISNMGI